MLELEDFQSRTWTRLRTVLQSRLDELREVNDGGHLNEIKTAAIRGQIAEVKKMLALGPAPTAGDEAGTE